MNKFTRRACGILAGVATLIAGLGGVSAANADDSAITSFTSNGSITVTGDGVDLSKAKFTAVPLAYYSSATISGTGSNQSVKSYDVSDAGHANEVVKALSDADLVKAATAPATGYVNGSGDAVTDFNAANPMEWVVNHLQSDDNYSGTIRTFLNKLAKNADFSTSPSGTDLKHVTDHPDELQATGLTPGVYAIVNTQAPGDKTDATTNTVTKYTTAIIAMVGTDVNGITTLGSKTNFLGQVQYKGYGNPTVTKKSLGNADDSHVNKGSDTTTAAQVGSVLKFQLTANIPNTNGYETYKFDLKDKPSAGLTFNNDNNIKITVNGTELTKDTDYTVTVANDGSVTFSLGNGNIAGNSKFPVGAAVVVTYTMTVNANAVTGTNPQTNEATIDYSNNPTTTGTGTTPSSKTTVYTGDVNVEKTDMNGNLISGAKFQLKEQGGSTPLKLVALETPGEYRLALASDETTTETMTVPASGKLHIKGLNGKYTLAESAPAPDYTDAGLPSTDITVNVAQKDDDSTTPKVSAGDVTVTATEDANKLVSFTKNGNLVTVKNARSITDMPKTGAIWLTIWVAAALLCAAGGFVLLHSRRKANAR